MITSRYESQFLILMKDSLIANYNCDQFINNSNKQIDLIGKVAFRITRLRYMSIEQAKAYIDVRTGRFRPGEYMTYCVDEELKGLFKELEVVTNEVNKHPWKTKEEAITNAAEKQKKVKSMLLLIKEEVGAEGAKEVLGRIMNLARVQTGVK